MLEGHERQAIEPPPEHVWQLAWQLVHTASEPIVAPNSSSAHSATHVPAERNGVAEPWHVRHSELVGPLHVPHAGSHAVHSLLDSAYLRRGVQDATQLPGGSKKGDDDAQVTQSVANSPVHVAQLSWHGVQVSVEAFEPPEHVKPSSIALQSPAQPSSATLLPSSQLSVPTRKSSPQMGEHVSEAWKEPPAQL